MSNVRRHTEMRTAARVSILFSFLLSGCASIEPRRAEVLWAGTYFAAFETRVAEPSALTGTVSSVRLASRLVQTTTINAQMGTRFGVEYRLLDFPVGTPVRFKAITRFPPGGLINTDTGRHADFDERERLCYVGERCASARVMSESWELKSGDLGL